MPASLLTSHESLDGMEVYPATSSEDSSLQQTFADENSSEFNPFSQIPSSDHDVQNDFNPFCRRDSSEHSIGTGPMSPKLSVTASEYRSELAINGIILIDPSIDPPFNLQDIRGSLSKTRNDINISEEERSRHCTLVDKIRSLNEAALIQAVLPALFDYTELYLSSEIAFHVGTRWTNQAIISKKLGQPQPDQTLGLPYDNKCIQYRQAFDAARDWFTQLQPAKGLVTPLLTVEIKGPGGSLDEARLQNRHNGACMVSNIVKLKRAAKQRVTTYRNRIQALTIEITPESVQVSCHWMDRKKRYLSGPVQPTTNIMELDRARQLVRNAIDWAKQELKNLDTVLFSGLEENPVQSRKRKREESTQADRSRKRARPQAGGRKKKK